MSTLTKTAGRPGSSRLKFAAFLAFVCVALVSSAALAQVMGIDFTKLPQTKLYTDAPKKPFEDATRVVTEEAPYGDPSLGYTFRIGKDWTENQQQLLQEGAGGTQPISDTVLGILARYTSKPINLIRSNIVIEAQQLTYEIGAKHWFLNFILNSGFSLNSMREISSRELIAMYVQVINDQTFVVRTRLLINGSRLILIRYYLPQENYEEFKTEQAQVIDSFKLLNVANERIEKQREFGFIDQSYFNYPSSWSLKSKSILSIERMSAQLFQQRIENKKSVLEGQIKINVISRLLGTTMAEEVKAFRDQFKIDNYTLGPLIENLDYRYDQSIQSGQAQMYKLIPKDPQTMRPYEFAVALLQGNDYYYIISIITPGRERDFFIWAQNIEALRIVAESMRRYQLPSDHDPNSPDYNYLQNDAQQEPPADEFKPRRKGRPTQIKPMVIPGQEAPVQ